MNIIVFIGILTGFFLIICANDFLSKFHQNDYKLKNLFAQNTYINTKYVEKYDLKTFKHNRTVTAFNATIVAKNDTGTKVELLVQAYKRTGIAYKMIPVRFQVNFCKLFNKNIIGIKRVLVQHGNVTSCQAKRGAIYHIYNFVVDESMLPPLIPAGEYKLESTALYLDEPLVVTMITAEIYYPMTKF